MQDVLILLVPGVYKKLN